MDPTSRRRFWDLIYRMAEGGTTVLVSTHYMEEAKYCHRLALMHRGRLIALDRPDRLRRDLHQPVLELVADDPARAVEALRDAPGVLEAAMYGRAVHVMVLDEAAGPVDIPRRLAAAGRRAGAIRAVAPGIVVSRLCSWAAIAPSLEDVFVALVRRQGGAVAE